MTSRLAVWGVVAALMLGNAGAFAAEPPPPGAVIADLTEAVKGLTAQVTTLNSTVQGTTGTLNAMNARLTNAERNVAKLSGVPKQLDKLQNDVSALTAVVSDQEAQLATLKSDVGALKKLAYDQGVLLDQWFDRGSDGGSRLRIAGNFQHDPAFRQEFKDAVRESLPPPPPPPQFGIVRIVNTMYSGQWMSVNGSVHYVAPLATRDVTVPVGQVVTQLLNYEFPQWWYEAPKPWVIGPPQYMQTITIHARAW